MTIASMKSGLFGAHVTLVPLAQASWDGITAGRSATAVDGTAVDVPGSGERRDLTGTPGVQGRDTSVPPPTPR